MVWKIVKIKFEDDERELYGVLDTSDGFFLSYEDIGIDRDGTLISRDLEDLKRKIGIPLTKSGEKKGD